MVKPAEFSEGLDPPVEDPKTSPYMRMKAKMTEKIEKKINKATREFREELEDNKSLENVRVVANDLVEPETLMRLKEIILDQPEIEPGCDWWLWYQIMRKSITWVMMKFIDIGTDLAVAYQHFKREDYKYGILTLFFVYLPGLVLSAGFTWWGLVAKREGEPPRRKEITLERLGKYFVCLLVFPLLYPIIQILLSVLNVL